MRFWPHSPHRICPIGIQGAQNRRVSGIGRYLRLGKDRQYAHLCGQGSVTIHRQRCRTVHLRRRRLHFDVRLQMSRPVGGGCGCAYHGWPRWRSQDFRDRTEQGCQERPTERCGHRIISERHLPQRSLPSAHRCLRVYALNAAGPACAGARRGSETLNRSAGALAAQQT